MNLAPEGCRAFEELFILKIPYEQLKIRESAGARRFFKRNPQNPMKIH